MDSGSRKNVWPPEIPVRMPRSTMSMPSVTMKPLSPNRMMNSALTAPTSTPTARVTGTDQPPGSRPSPWPAPTGTVSQAATPGASPTVDSSDRSIFLTISTSVCARTRIAISDMVWSTLSRLSPRRKTGLTSWPTIAITMIAGMSARSRSRAKAIRLPPPARVGASSPSGSLAVVAVAVLVSTIEVDSFHGGHELVVVPAAGDLGDHTALEHHQDPVAQAQVVEFVGGDEHPGAG